MVDNEFYEIDAVLQSYQKALLLILFKSMNRLFDCKIEQLNPKKQQEHYGEEESQGFEDDEVKHREKLLSKCGLLKSLFNSRILSSSKEKQFIVALHNTVRKWCNFEYEKELSRIMFDTMFKYDLVETGIETNTYSNYSEMQNSLEEDKILSLCNKALPFFCSSEIREKSQYDKHENSVIDVIEEVRKLRKRLNSTGDNKAIKSIQLEMVQNNSVFHLICILLKANGLVDFKFMKEWRYIEIFNQLVSEIYELLKEATYRNTVVSQCVWGYSSYFLRLNWVGINCRKLHIELVIQLISQLNVQKLNYDSVIMFTKIIKDIGHLMPEEVK